MLAKHLPFIHHFCDLCYTNKGYTSRQQIKDKLISLELLWKVRDEGEDCYSISSCYPIWFRAM